MKWEEDEIVAEVRASRKKIFEECGNSLNALGQRLMRSQEQHPERLATDVPPARRASRETIRPA